MDPAEIHSACFAKKDQTQLAAQKGKAKIRQDSK